MSKRVRTIAPILMVLLADLPHPGGCDGCENKLEPCTTSDDCGSSYRCIGSKCVYRGYGYCESDTDCPVGQVCDQTDQSCASTPEAALPARPDIAVDATMVDFGFAPNGFLSIVHLTLANHGLGPLHVSELRLVEDSAVSPVQEFFSDPSGVFAPPLEIGPGQTRIVEVSVLPTDCVNDTAALLILSDDPDEPLLEVSLLISSKGVPTLAACSTSEATDWPVPRPPWENATCDATGLDFGSLMSGQDATALLLLWNEAQGNAGLTIEDVSLSNLSGQAAAYALTTWRANASAGGNLMVAQPPQCLGAGSVLHALEPDLFIVAVTLSASGICFPAETLTVQTNDPLTPYLVVPLTGLIDGC